MPKIDSTKKKKIKERQRIRRKPLLSEEEFIQLEQLLNKNKESLATICDQPLIPSNNQLNKDQDMDQEKVIKDLVDEVCEIV